MTKRSMLCAQALGLAVFAAVWELASHWMGDYWVPGIGQIAGRLWNELLTGKLLVDFAATTRLLSRLY